MPLTLNADESPAARDADLPVGWRQSRFKTNPAERYHPGGEATRAIPRQSTGERVVINYSALQPARPRPVRVHYRRSLEEVLKQAAASIDRKGKAFNLGRFNPLPQGRPLTRKEKFIGLTLAAAFSLAVWIHARPEPVNAHTGYFRSLALTTGADILSVRAFTDSALRAIGQEWKAPVLFAHAHPLFWERAPAIHPNALAQQMETGLMSLAGHGPIVSVTVLGTPELGASERADGTVDVTSRVTGQVELAAGIVVRFNARLIQDEKTRRWGIVELTLPPFLP
jgi:hypothetical protein